MNRYLVIGLLALSLAVRLAAGFWWQQRLPAGAKFGFGDSESYWVLAGTIARGEPYEMDEHRKVFRTPGYPVMLAGLFRLAGEEPPVMWARALSAICGTLTVAGVMWLAWLLFDVRAASLAGIAAALYPEAVAASAFVLTEAPFGPFMLLHLGLWVLAFRANTDRRARRRGLAAGVVAGLATLIRPSWLLFVPFAAALALLDYRRFRRHLWIGASMTVGLVAAMIPWWVRNYSVSLAFVPTTLQVGESLYDGWNPQATGASDMRFLDRLRPRRPDEFDCAPSQPAAEHGNAQTRLLYERRLDNLLRDKALAWARDNPRRVAELAGIKFLRLWNVWPNEPSLRSWPIRLAVAAGYVPLLGLGFAGVWRFARRGWPWILCSLPAAYFTGLHMVFVGSIRYREPAMMALIVLAAGVAAGMRRTKAVGS